MAEATEDKIHTSYTQSRDHHPPSSSSSSPVSSRRDSLRSYHLGIGPNPPTPTSPLVRLTRKRAASVNTDTANQPRIEDLVLNTPSSAGIVSAGEKVCLCQPDPKIPRPRNGMSRIRFLFLYEIGTPTGCLHLFYSLSLRIFNSASELTSTDF